MARKKQSVKKMMKKNNTRNNRKKSSRKSRKKVKSSRMSGGNNNKTPEKETTFETNVENFIANNKPAIEQFFNTYKNSRHTPDDIKAIDDPIKAIITYFETKFNDNEAFTSEEEKVLKRLLNEVYKATVNKTPDAPRTSLGNPNSKPNSKPPQVMESGDLNDSEI